MVDISVCIITLGRETLYHTLETVFSQKINSTYEVIIILQGLIDEDRITSVNPNNIPFHIYTFERWFWFWFYRNKAVSCASWDILAWIDDDEWAMDKNWLALLTCNIKNKKYSVVTSGYYIPLGQWYMTDCISLLGWPGWGALGFDRMWDVSLNNQTNHICTGNFAIKRSIMEQIGFSNDAKYGWEDNFLSKSLSNHKIIIMYEKSATVYHISRTFLQAFFWWQLRVKSHKKAVGKSLYEEKILKKKIRFLRNVIRLDFFLPGKIICLFFIGLIFIYNNLIFYMQKMKLIWN